MCSCIYVHGILALLQLSTFKWQVAEKKKLREGSVADSYAEGLRWLVSRIVFGGKRPAAANGGDAKRPRSSLECYHVESFRSNSHKMSQPNLDHLPFSENIENIDSLLLEACACK